VKNTNKRHFFLFVVFFCIFLPLKSQATPHLILHFDINKTIVANDKAANKSVDNILNEMLAIKYKFYWDSNLVEPISYLEYVQKILIPGPINDPDLRTQRKYFIHHFKDYLLEVEHPLYNAVQEDYQKASTLLNDFPSIVFPSFYNLLKHLKDKEILHTIILRSFGSELFDVKNEVNRCHNNMFSRICRFSSGKLVTENGTFIEEPYAIYKHLTELKHTVIQDDWDYWNANGMSSDKGKPFYIHTEDLDTLSIFFDDNIIEDNSINIISCFDPITEKKIPIQELIQSGQAVRVDTLEAILNENYFIEQLEIGLKNHNEIKALIKQ
jgi:hypothetical protein